MKRTVLLSLKLRFDSRFVYNGPYRFYLAAAEPVEHIFCKRHFAPVDIEAEEAPSRRAVKSQAARNVRGLADQEMNVETKVRDFVEIPFQHPAIT